MNIDIRTLVILAGIASLLQVIALFLQYRLNKVHQGVGWWTLKWYRCSGHLEKRVIETKLLEVRYDNKEKELFKAI